MKKKKELGMADGGWQMSFVLRLYEKEKELDNVGWKMKKKEKGNILGKN